MNDDVLMRRFEACELSPDKWHHREHLRLAYLYLLRCPPAEALDRMRAGWRALPYRFINSSIASASIGMSSIRSTTPCSVMRTVFSRRTAKPSSRM